MASNRWSEWNSVYATIFIKDRRGRLWLQAARKQTISRNESARSSPQFGRLRLINFTPRAETLSFRSFKLVNTLSSAPLAASGFPFSFHLSPSLSLPLSLSSLSSVEQTGETAHSVYAVHVNSSAPVGSSRRPTSALTDLLVAFPASAIPTTSPSLSTRKAIPVVFYNFVSTSSLFIDRFSSRSFFEIVTTLPMTWCGPIAEPFSAFSLLFFLFCLTTYEAWFCLTLYASRFSSVSRAFSFLLRSRCSNGEKLNKF